MTPASALVIYHADCTDGACAAWAARFHLNRAGLEAVMLPTHPGVTPEGALDGGPWRHVFVVDVCIPRVDVEQLGAWVLDHHKTNEPILDGWERTRFDIARSGAGLAWDEVQKILDLDRWRRPWFVDYVEDRDLWRWALPNSREVNASLGLGKRSPEDFEDFDPFSRSAPWEIEDRGRAILATEREGVARAVHSATRGELFGIGLSVVSCPLYQSEIGEALLESGTAACIWYLREDEKRGPVAQVSLRSRDDLPDVSELATRLGGGGHRNSAGAVVPAAKWLSLVAQWSSGPRKTARVFIASPLRGDITRNQAYAREALKDSLERGEAPFVPHLLYDQVLDDRVEAERHLAMNAAMTFLSGCNVLAVYEDLGVSAGMRGEIERAEALGLTIERRRLRPAAG